MAVNFAKMIGPLPTGAWIAVVGGGLGLTLYTRRQAKSVAPVPVDNTSGVPGVGVGGSGQFIPLNPPESVTPAATITTNDGWGIASINWLIASGYDAAMADSAIRKYLAGSENVSIQEYALIRLSLVKFGSPPQPLPPPITNPPPSTVINPPTIVPPTQAPPPVVAPPPPPPPAPIPTPSAVRYYTVVRGDNLSAIARRFYGSADWPRIYNANRAGQRRADGSLGMIVNANLIFPGWRLIIP